MAWPRAFALLIWTSVAAALAGGGLLLARWPDVGMTRWVVTASVLLPSVVLGLVIAVRWPRTRVAPLLCLLGTVPMVDALGELYTAVLSRHPGALPTSDLYVALSQGLWMVLYVPAALLTLTFPDGRLLGPR